MIWTLDVGPAISLAEKAIETGSAEQVTEYLTGVLRDELKHRLEQVNALVADAERSLPDARAHVEAMLGFQVYCHHVLRAMRAPAHEEAGRGHGHG